MKGFIFSGKKVKITYNVSLSEYRDVSGVMEGIFPASETVNFVFVQQRKRGVIVPLESITEIQFLEEIHLQEKKNDDEIMVG